jgi:PAS domain S-box-containing protein
MYDKIGHRRTSGSFVVHGLYGNVINNEKSFFTNDPLSHPDSIGVLSIWPFPAHCISWRTPLSVDGKIIGMLGVANRGNGYSSEQQVDLEAVTPAIVQAIQRKKVELERKQAEKTLKESEQRLQAIIDGSDNAFYVKNLGGSFIFINKHLKKLLGMNRDEFIGKNDYDFFTPELADCYKMHDSKILETEIPEQLEEVSYMVDGWHTFIANKFSLYDSQGKLYAICGISTDITEHKHTQLLLKADMAALTRMHELSKKLLGTAGIQPLLDEIMYSAIAIAGAQLGTLQLLEDDSLRIVSHYGHQQPFLDFFASAENVASVCEEAMQRWERVIIEDIETSSLFVGTPSLDVMRTAGVRAVQSTPMVSRTGELLGILTTQWDVPYSPDEHVLWRIYLLAWQAADMIEQERSARKLMESERIYRAIGESIDYGVWVCDPDGRNIYASPSFLKMVGITQQQCSDFG